MIAALLKYWQIGAGAALGALLAAGPVYLYGASHGRQEAAVNAIKETAEAYQERANTNEAINSLDPVARCIELGGLQSDCEQQLRGLAENPGSIGDSRLPRRK